MDLEAGDLLISPPMMPDPRFRESVIIVTQHNEHGSYGLCLNKQTMHTINDLASDIGVRLDEDIALYWGGPVNPTTVWMLHSNDWSMTNTVEINSHWSMTSNLKMFHAMSRGEYPSQYRLFFGFSNWAPEQLEKELVGAPPWHHQSSWLVWHHPHDERILDVEPNQLWNVSTSQCGRQAINSWL